MSLYEVSAHLFYGTLVQRMGESATPNPPLTGDPDYATSYLKELGLWTPVPDWHTPFSVLQKKDRKIQTLRDLPSDHEIMKIYAEAEAAIKVQTFGCEFVQTGDRYDADDWSIYIMIAASESSCGDRGETVISPDKLIKGETWDEQLAQFCAKIGVPAELVRPRWTLTLRG